MAGGGSGAGNQNDEADSHDEIWLPVWYQATGLNELNGLFQEGRATVGRRPAKDGLDFARAVASLGVDRGITEFQRYGFMMRSGKSYLATPISRIATRANPSAELISDLERNRFWTVCAALPAVTKRRRDWPPWRINWKTVCLTSLAAQIGGFAKTF